MTHTHTHTHQSRPRSKLTLIEQTNHRVILLDMSEVFSFRGTRTKTKATTASIKKTKHVSWGADWTWQEGEEEKTRTRKRAFKSRRTRARAEAKAPKMNRTPEEEKEYRLMQARWALMTIKDPRFKDEIIRICSVGDNYWALTSLQHTTKLLGYPIEQTRTLRQALDSIAGDDTITSEALENNNRVIDCLHSFIREPCIRNVFVPHSHPLSTTDDTRERERRAVVAARGIEGEGLLNEINQVQPELQRMIISFTRQFGTNDEAREDAGRSRFMQRYGLTNDLPPAAAEAAPAPVATSHHNSDETGTTFDAPTDHTDTLQTTGSSDKEDKDDATTNSPKKKGKDDGRADEDEHPDDESKEPTPKRQKND